MNTMGATDLFLNSLTGYSCVILHFISKGNMACTTAADPNLSNILFADPMYMNGKPKVLVNFQAGMWP